MKTAVIKIAGMMCQGCVAGVTMALEDAVGVSAVSVSLERHEAVVTYDETKTSLEQLQSAVIEEGFRVE